MAVSFNPFVASQIQAGGDTLQTQGNNTIENHSITSPYTVPEGANYVLVTFDAATTITATPLKGQKHGEQVTGYSINFANAGQVEIPNVIGGVTVITTA